MQRHGELKTPGGKLVVVDLELSEETIAAAAISGDFFLEPESALEDMTAALVGLSAEASESEIAAAIEGRLPTGAELIGFSASAVAAAVKRALTDGSPRERL